MGPGCLTAVFGMGTGVAIQVCSPESCLGPAVPGGRLDADISIGSGKSRSARANSSQKEA